MAAVAANFDVPEIVRPTVSDGDAVVNLQAVRPATANADAIAGVNQSAELTPRPPALDLPSCLQVVVLGLSS